MAWLLIHQKIVRVYTQATSITLQHLTYNMSDRQPHTIIIHVLWFHDRDRNDSWSKIFGANLYILIFVCDNQSSRIFPSLFIKSDIITCFSYCTVKTEIIAGLEVHPVEYININFGWGSELFEKGCSSNEWGNIF